MLTAVIEVEQVDKSDPDGRAQLGLAYRLRGNDVRGGGRNDGFPASSSRMRGSMAGRGARNAGMDPCLRRDDGKNAGI